MLWGGGMALRAGAPWAPVSTAPQVLTGRSGGALMLFGGMSGTIMRHLGLYGAILQALWTVGGFWKPY